MKEAESVNYPEKNFDFDNIAQKAWDTFEERRLQQIQEDPTTRAIELPPSYVWSFVNSAEGYLRQEKQLQSFSNHPDSDGKINSLEKTMKAFMNTKVVKRSAMNNQPSLLRVNLNSQNVLSLHDFVIEHNRLQSNIEFEEKRALISLSEKIEREYLEAPIVEKKVNRIFSLFRKKG